MLLPSQCKHLTPLKDPTLLIPQGSYPPLASDPPQGSYHPQAPNTFGASTPTSQPSKDAPPPYSKIQTLAIVELDYLYMSMSQCHYQMETQDIHAVG